MRQPDVVHLLLLVTKKFLNFPPITFLSSEIAAFASPMAALAAWSSLKTEAKTLEQYVEMRLHGNIPTSATPVDVESGDPAAVRLREIEDALGKLASVVERLGSAATASASAANLAVGQVSVAALL